MSKPALQSIVGDYYSNILALDPDSNPLTTISARRAKWYLDKGLAVSLGEGDGYSNRIQFTFKPKKNNSNSFLQAILPTQCVVCGAKENLTIHHVIPMAVKRFFPEVEKNHTRQWCVLLCEPHHLEAEKLCRPIYEKSLQDAVKVAHQGFLDKNKAYHKLINNLYGQNTTIKRIIEGLPEEEKKVCEPVLTNLLIDEKLILDLREATVKLRSLGKDKVKAAKAAWGQAFIEQSGGVEALKALFRDAFLALKPQFLPEGFLVDYDNL